MTAPELKPCPFCCCLPDGYEGRQVSCRCGAMGPIETPNDPESATWNTRADLSQAAIAAAMMGADAKVAACLEDAASNVSNEVTPSWAADLIAKIIRSRTPADATAALEAVKAQVRDEALEQTARYLTNTYMGMKEVAAAIRAMKGGA